MKLHHHVFSQVANFVRGSARQLREPLASSQALTRGLGGADGFLGVLRCRRSTGASDTGRANSDVVVPESVDIPTVRLPTEVDSGDFGLDRALRPLVGVGVGLGRKTSNGIAIQPSLNGAVGAQVVFEAFPGAGRKGGRGGNALWGEGGKGGVVGLAVVHQDLALATNAEMFSGGLSGVGHGDEGDVGVGEGL